MSCQIPIENGVRKSADCKCYGAVMKAYGTMLSLGQPEHVAKDVAVTIYAYHHPEDSKHDQALTVESWVNEGHLH